ncbi:MAG: GtrA family protein [Defluviitaleaceae bacterium]|nr:GtrA family protein [Defluviitaleaceae bacterium]
MKKLKTLFDKHREIILYLFFGGATTAVNTVLHLILSFGAGLDAWLSSTISVVVAVIFAFFVNKIFVFESKQKTRQGVARELALFIASRAVSSVIYVGILFVFVDVMGLNEIVFLAAAQVFVIVFNYVASKWLIFKKN